MHSFIPETFCVPLVFSLDFFVYAIIRADLPYVLLKQFRFSCCRQIHIYIYKENLKGKTLNRSILLLLLWVRLIEFYRGLIAFLDGDDRK